MTAKMKLNQRMKSQLLGRNLVWIIRIPSTVVLMVALALPVSYSEPPSEQLWAETLTMVREQFPTVQHISTEAFAELLNQGEDLTLLDIRELEEYEVSHIKDAEHARNARAALKLLKDTERERKVVVYCSVGYRSSQAAAKLIESGFSNVFNLEGSLFKWANESRPVHRGETQTTEVHPYDKDWGRLLDGKYWQ